MKRKKVGIIGLGFVGSRLASELSVKCDVITYDKKDTKEYPTEALASCNFVMVCVDTPSKPDGSVDIQNVEGAIQQIPSDKILIRSTIPPGTTNYLANKYEKSICFAPEYIGESVFLGSSWMDVEKKKSFFILGGTPEHRQAFLDDIEFIFGPNTIIMQMSASEAELVKYMENSYFALKICFVNEFRALAETLGLNWHSVREGWLLDSRVERDHTSAFREEPGYNGKCLPKDVSGIIKFAEQHSFCMHIMRAVSDYNERIRNGTK